MVADLCLSLLRFSGLTADDFVGVDMTLEEVQRRLLRMVAADTILLGHSLESDLRALKVPLPPSPALPLTPLAPPSLLPLSQGHPQQCGGHGHCVPSPKGSSLQTSPQDPYGRAPAEIHSGQRR